jgi:superfamily I DNA/RNA helicase/mRNA-degrading endonuclease RelE of RelBE toxin-antitoxin system
MTTQWQMTMKPVFLHSATMLAAKELHQVIAKVDMLAQDPLPDGKVKKQLTHLPGKPYRIRSGDYRIIYTLEKQNISVLKLEKRREDTYKGAFDIDAEQLDDAEAGFEDGEEGAADTASAAIARPDWESFVTPKNKALPEPITVELLKQLRVPEVYQQRLLPLKTQEDLLGCPGIDDEILLKIDEYMFELPLVKVLQQPDLVLNDVDDLLRYKEGELLSFLLKLSPEQEKYVSWSINATGPTLVKGGPGTGKSTIALYRIRSILEQLRRTGKGTPRLLFTTYTNALIKSSEQLLQQLLGANAQYVRVSTADKLAYDILYNCGQISEIATDEELMQLLKQAVAVTPFEGNLLQQQAQKQTLARMGSNYLLQEILQVIIARQVRNLEEYLQAPRAGRKLPLNVTQRGVVWRVYLRWRYLLYATGHESWQQRRARAEELAQQSDLYQRYDAVIIDEAQDLDPSTLRMLIKLCKTPKHIFVTADANQSIYGSGFTWSAVHEDLKFQGRTSILRANYRSTGEIGEAAQSYLTYGALEPESTARLYIHSGPTPDVRAVLNSDYEAQLLANFFKKASLQLRLALGSCALLCPNERVGKAIAVALVNEGTEATYMPGQELNLARTGIKVLTLNSSKGLEFPIVALAGFMNTNYPIIPAGASDEEYQELLARERRTMFVGMTRAMRALLVVVPITVNAPLLQGFDLTYWNMSRKI